MEIVNIKVSKLAANTGQVAGLPTNPRQWTAKDVERLARSLAETPELFDARPCLVYPYGDRFVVLGGNMRLSAAKHNGAKEVPCIVFPADTPADKLREIVVKDNGAFGAWDFDALANEWDDLPLVDWGVPVWTGASLSDLSDLGEAGDLTADTLPKPGESLSGYTSITFLFPMEEVDVVNDYIKTNGKETLVAEILQLCRNLEAK